MTSSIRWCFIIVVLAVTVASQQHQKRAIASSDRLQLADDVIAKDRELRQTNKVRTTARPKGFFGTIAQLFFEQINDTKSAYRQLSDLVNAQFSDDPAPSKTSTASAPITEDGGDVTTTEEPPPKLNRQDFLRIIQNNLIGLRRLYDLEMRDAWRDSKKNIQEYSQEFHRELYKQFKD